MSNRSTPAPTSDLDISDLTKRFAGLLQTKRLNHLQQISQQRSSSPAASDRSGYACLNAPSPQTHQPPTYTSIRNLPIYPEPPKDAASLKFRNLMLALSVTPTKYENPGLLDEALAVIPLDRIYADADDRHQEVQVIAQSLGPNVKPEWGYQDCVIQALLKYVCYISIASATY